MPRFGRRLEVADYLFEDELEIWMEVEHQANYIIDEGDFITKDEILELIAHLTKVTEER